ncbi:hypothetical protein HAX54_014308 [Datura stramonium]|uniref:Uncharacterized protein n=1 Tax=Datura stramonium TaxID=4076 RepID=A0ABS8TPZ1_DATST|nr:hypothetical protein [Datura stramonium]
MGDPEESSEDDFLKYLEYHPGFHYDLSDDDGPTGLFVLIKLAELHYNLRSKSKMIESNESNTAANILMSTENPESSQRREDVQNDEQMTHLEQELEVLKEELCQVRDLTWLNVATFSQLPIFRYARSGTLS